MSKLAEKFLKIKTWEEFDRRREEFRELSTKEPGVAKHFNSILPKIDDKIDDGIIREAFRETPAEK